MLDARIAEMIQADVDGELPAADCAELDRVLAESAEARQFREEMMRISHLLSSLPPVEPPSGLGRRVLERAELPSRPRRSIVGRWFQPASYGLAVAAGVLIAVGIGQVVPTDSGDISNLVGSMVRHGDVADLEAPAGDRLSISLAAVNGTVELSGLDQAAWAVEFDVSSVSAVDWLVDLESSGLQFGGFADPDAGVDVIEVSGGKVHLKTSGRQRFVVFLRESDGAVAAAGSVRVALSHQGEALFSGQLSAREKES